MINKVVSIVLLIIYLIALCRGNIQLVHIGGLIIGVALTLQAGINIIIKKLNDR